MFVRCDSCMMDVRLISIVDDLYGYVMYVE